ncbi:MAG: SLC13 family permease [Desulfobacterales bacterium]|nr:SLC13 family permease [Desulfobacterales bacterium]
MELQSIIILTVFAGVILAIALNLADMTLAAMLGVSVLIAGGILTEREVLNAVRSAGGPLSLLFGGMVVARTLEPTGIFEQVGIRFLSATKGSGKRFLLGVVALVSVLCAFLPNATTVILLAPIIIRITKALDVDFVGPMVVMAVISNSAGLLTLIGDPATFLVGSSIGMTFVDYLQRVSLGGLLNILVLIPLLPLVLRDVWHVQRTLPADLKPKPLKRPLMAAFSLLVLVAMIFLFMFGESLPTHIVPPAVAIIAASLALLVIYGAKIESIENVLKDVDWKTLLFLLFMFGLVEAFNKTGLIQNLSIGFYQWFGVKLMPVAVMVLVVVGLGSSVLANIPLVAAMIIMLKGYFVAAQLVPEEALGPAFNAWPAPSLPVFVAMMFAGTLGGNATLIGASANIVSAGICASNGKPVGFTRFMRYGVPLTVCQLAVSAAYVMILFAWSGH